jgi:hypothetical protein
MTTYTRPVIGYGAPDSAADHARKLPAWMLRLRSAIEALDAAVLRRDRVSAHRHFADSWFWSGRITADILGAADDPASAGIARAAAEAIIDANRSLTAARRFLLTGW